MPDRPFSFISLVPYIVQETIRTAFADCTTLTIAHRLHTIMDSDRILILDAGSILEFDSPKKLLKVMLFTASLCIVNHESP